MVGFAWLAVRSGLAARPAELGWGALAGGGLLAGIGFTMALFIAGLAFQGGLLDAAKLGILAASILSATGGLAMLTWLARRRGHRAAVADGARTAGQGVGRRGPGRMVADSRESAAEGTCGKQAAGQGLGATSRQRPAATEPGTTDASSTS